MGALSAFDRFKVAKARLRKPRADDVDKRPLPIGRFGKVLARCRQLNHFARMAGQVSEPEWKACLGLAFTENGREIAHEYSKGDPRYDPEETDTKFDERAKLTGPTTCKYFQEKVGASLCDACTWRSASLVTPLNVGRFP